MAFPQQGPQQGAPEEEMAQQPPMPQPQQPPMAGGGMPQMQQQAGAMPQSTIDGEELQMLLISRFGQLEPSEQDQFADLVNPETIPVLFKMFPELGILFDKIMELQNGGMPEQEMQDQPMEEEPENPLINDNLSRGLMG